YKYESYAHYIGQFSTRSVEKFCDVPTQAYSSILGPTGEENITPPSPPAAHNMSALSRVHIALIHQVRLGQHVPAAPSGLVDQPFQALLHKPLHPLVDKTAADANCSSNVGDRYPASQE